MATYEPLRSHDFHDLVWRPPVPERFVTYDRRDEAWMRPLGLGTVVKVKCDLYDVRDEHNELIGYTSHRPSMDRPWMSLPYSSVANPSCFTGEDEQPRISTEAIDLHVGYCGIAGQRFCFWQAQLSDAPKLILGRFITTIGEDNIRAFSRRMEMKSRQRDYQLYGPLK